LDQCSLCKDKDPDTHGYAFYPWELQQTNTDVSLTLKIGHVNDVSMTVWDVCIKSDAEVHITSIVLSVASRKAYLLGNVSYAQGIDSAARCPKNNRWLLPPRNFAIISRLKRKRALAPNHQCSGNKQLALFCTRVVAVTL